VYFTGKWSDPFALGQKTWLFLSLSALATGASWVYYFRALQMGEASKVAPFALIFLDERPGLRDWPGMSLVTAFRR